MPFDDFVADSSEGKRISHSRLVNFLNKFGGSAVQRMYKKDQLERLSLAYGVQVSSRANKTTLASNLVPAIQGCTSVPNPCFLNNLRAEASANDHSQRVVLRISRVH